MSNSVRISSITIENFKGISKPVTVPIKPITLLFGKNSAGKSTILQALSYIREILESQNIDARYTASGGDEIELGGFSEFIHKKDKTKNAIFRLEFTGNTFLGLDLSEDRYLNDFQVSSSDGDTVNDFVGNLHDWNIANMEGFYLEFEIAYSSTLSKPCLIRYTVGDIFEDSSHSSKIADIMYTPGNLDAQICNINDMYLFKMDIDRADGKSDQIDILQQLYDACSNIKQPDTVYETSFSFATDKKHGALPKLGKRFHFPNLLPEEKDKEEEGYIDHYNAAHAVMSMLTEYMIKPAEQALEYLSGIRYIGPIREIPFRDFNGSTDIRKSHWSNGLAAWDELYNAKPSETEKSTGLIEKVNDYLRDTLALGYELRREDMIEINTNSPAMNTLRKAALQFEEIDEQQLRDAVQDLENCPVKKSLHIEDLKNNIEVAPSDIGVGISQVVPVVVGTLAKRDNGTQPSILSIEQPELHIHPAVQCALGDLFIREKSDNRLFLIETHSEHLILRFLRRISESTDNKRKDRSLELAPDEISVIYVNTPKNELILTELPVDEDGEFTVRWPEGFFEERATELFGEPDA